MDFRPVQILQDNGRQGCRWGARRGISDFETSCAGETQRLSRLNAAQVRATASLTEITRHETALALSTEALDVLRSLLGICNLLLPLYHAADLSYYTGIGQRADITSVEII